MPWLNRRAILIGSLLILAMLAIDAVVAFSSLGAIAGANQSASTTREDLARLERILALLREVRSAQRGYLLTGDPEELRQFDSAARQLPGLLETLRGVADDAPDRSARVEALSSLIPRLANHLQETVDLRRRVGIDAAMRVVRTDVGTGLFREARDTLVQLIEESSRSIEATTERSQAAVRRAILVMTGSTALGVLAVALAIFLQKREAERIDDAARRIQISQDWLTITLDSIGDAVIATDGAGRVRLLNPIAEDLTGWTEADAIGRPISEVCQVVHEVTRNLPEHPVDRVIREGAAVTLANSTAVVSRQGAETPIEETALPIRNEHGEIQGVVMVFRDVTSTRTVATRLRENEQLFRTLADSISQLAWMADEDGAILWYNQRWYDYTGKSEEEMLGWGWTSVHDAEMLPAIVERFKAAMERGHAWEDTFPLRRHDGVMRWHLSRALPVRDESGQIVRWFGTNTDITEQREQAEQLRRNARELALAKQEAEFANAAKSHFLAVLSHELRTPLNPILLVVTSLLDEPDLPPAVHNDLETVKQYVNLQARLIDDLLDVMRIVTGKMPLHWETANLHQLIQQAVQICRSEVFGRRHRLELALEAQNPTVKADPARMQQVLWNLIKNAVKFTPEGGLITLRTRDNLETGSLEIEVTDSGIGMEPEARRRVFDPFQQETFQTNRRFGGLGLGLAIAKGIVDAHEGTISVESAGRDQGTTFRIQLPTLPTNPNAKASTADTPEPQGRRPPAQPLRILLVEDEPTTIRLMERLLVRLGHEVRPVGTVADAIARGRQGPIDLLISDLGLPDGSGLEIVRAIREEQGPVPAIALTGYGMEDDVERSREAGFVAHLTKPIDFQRLEIVIGQITSNS